MDGCEKDKREKNKNIADITSFKLIVKFFTRFSLRKNLFTLSSGQLNIVSVAIIVKKEVMLEKFNTQKNLTL